MTGNGNVDMGKFFNKIPQVWEQNIFAQGSADSDCQVSHAESDGAAQLVLSQGQRLEGGLDMGIEQLAFRGQADAPGTAVKELYADIFLQFLDGFADGRLADIQLFGSFGNISGIGDCIKNPV